MSEARLFNRSFLLCALANLVQGTSFNLFLHFPGYLKQLGTDEVEIGLIWGVTAVAAIAVRPTLGRWMDRRGRRGAILLGNLLNVLGVALYLTVTAIGPWVYVIRVLHGVGEAILFTSLTTFAADHVPEQRMTEGLALFGVSGMITISLGGVLGDVILAHADYPTLFEASLVGATLGLLFSLPLRDRPRDPHVPFEEPRGFRAALLQEDLLPLWWVTLTFATALASIFAFVKTFVMTRDVGTVGDFFTAYTVTAVALRLSLGWLPDRVGPKRLLFPALLVLALGFLSLASADSARDVLVAGVLCGLGHGLTFPILFGLAVRRARRAERGSAMAIYTALFDVGLLVGGPLHGWIIETASYSAMYTGSAVLIVTGALSFFLWDRSR